MFCNFESWYIWRLFFHLRGFHYPKHICSLANDRKIYVQLFHLVILINIICLSMYFICGCLIFYIGFILFWICYIHVIILILIIFHISFAKPCFWWKRFLLGEMFWSLVTVFATCVSKMALRIVWFYPSLLLKKTTGGGWPQLVLWRGIVVVATIVCRFSGLLLT